MIQVFGQRGPRVTRKGIAIVCAFWLNLLLLPCAMAIEASDATHDCCPPTIEWQQLDCCEIDAVNPDKRSGKFEFDADPAAVSMPVSASLRQTAQREPPPDFPPPDNTSPPLHKLYCVYLD